MRHREQTGVRFENALEDANGMLMLPAACAKFVDVTRIEIIAWPVLWCFY
jgi:hypothetical protein